MKFNGLHCSPDTMYLLSDAESRSISSENKTGAKSGGGREPIPVDENGNKIGAARELGVGWKVKPCEKKHKVNRRVRRATYYAELCDSGQV